MCAYDLRWGRLHIFKLFKFGKRHAEPFAKSRAGKMRRMVRRFRCREKQVRA